MVSHASTVPNYWHYLAAGSYHTILTSTDFFTERSAGPTFNSWMAAMLDGLEAWRNIACPDCLTALPCTGP